MFARITRYKMKVGSRDAAIDLLNSLRNQIMGLPGMLNFVNVMNADGAGYVVSVVESKALSDANAARVGEIWRNFGDYLEGAPVAEGYDVIANWSK